MALGVTPFEALQVFALTVAVPLSVLAVRGFGDAPFAHVLRPLPVATVAFLIAVSVPLLPLAETAKGWIVALAMGVGTLAVVWMTARLFLLVSQRRKL
jgi:hypothetical protein